MDYDKIINIGGTTYKVLPNDYIPKKLVVGRSYHLHWANTGAIWKLIAYSDDTCKLETPKSKKILIAKTSELRETRERLAATILARVAIKKQNPNSTSLLTIK